MAPMQKGMYSVVQNTNYQQQPMFAQQQPIQVHRNNTGWDRHAGRGGNAGRGQQHARGTPRAKYYCWIHVMCNHTSTSWKSPMQGHQYHATFQNRCNGNAHGCQRFEAWQWGTVLCEKTKIKLNDLNFDTLNTVVPPPSPVLNNSVVVNPDSGATGN